MFVHVLKMNQIQLDTFKSRTEEKLNLIIIV